MTPIEFSANFRRYTPEMSAALMRIARAFGEIQGARLLPAVADQLRASARAITVHYSNLIEGNELPAVEAERAIRGELSPDSRAKVELINYVEALDLIDQRLDGGGLELTPAFLKELHGTVTRGLGREDDPHFKPHHEGEWRDGLAVVQDRLTGKIMHEGPPPDDVPRRVAGMFEWLERRVSVGEPPYVAAGVLHYGITDIHPFADGNGRVARLFQAALLMKEGVLPGRVFSFERYYADDRDAYYGALRSVRAQTQNMEFWLAYFLDGLAEEYERVAATVSDLSTLVQGEGPGALQLTQSQERALTALRLEGRREFSRHEYEVAAGLRRSAAGADLQTLVRHGIVVPRGSGPATRYLFSGVASASGMGRGRPPKWTDAKIEQELRSFLVGRTEWPSPDEFQQAGHGALYAAASRRGGIGRWRRAMGL